MANKKNKTVKSIAIESAAAQQMLKLARLAPGSWVALDTESIPRGRLRMFGIGNVSDVITKHFPGCTLITIELLDRDLVAVGGAL